MPLFLKNRMFFDISVKIKYFYNQGSDTVY